VEHERIHPRPGPAIYWALTEVAVVVRREFFLQNNSIHQEDNTFRPLAISLCYHRTPRPLDELSRDGWVVAKHQAVTRFIGLSLDIYLSVILHDRSLSSVARDESRMARDESHMARDESRMARDESRMARDESLRARDQSQMARDESRMGGDYCWPDKSIHRYICTHSHLYSYIYGLVALLDNIQSSFSSITI
jgi:hypothetical protein